MKMVSVSSFSILFFQFVIRSNDPFEAINYVTRLQSKLSVLVSFELT